MITLTTDFGADSPYIAAMKAAIFERLPQAIVLDLTHSIAPQNIRQGALVWHDFTQTFPPESVHVCVIDPEVGGNRRLVAARCRNQFFVCPDNGVLTLFLQEYTVIEAVELNKPQFWRSTVSATFHGRDVMSPIAAAIADGVPLDKLGTKIAVSREHTSILSTNQPLVQIPFSAPIFSHRFWRLEVLYIDPFGNLLLNVAADKLIDTVKSQLSRSSKLRLTTTAGVFFDAKYVATYCHQLPGNVVLLEGSGGRWEIAIVNGNAAQTLGIAEGDAVTVECFD
ncbi:MAG: SAM-dependent chlorinase/fluorinase [Planctomycetaceae bacterium]|jgi:S-adenosylmethionine hydrolase|nr:SAM-dependent chlorinase/fluorinase [Planctomycetaceae bacterium]